MLSADLVKLGPTAVRRHGSQLRKRRSDRGKPRSSLNRRNTAVCVHAGPEDSAKIIAQRFEQVSSSLQSVSQESANRIQDIAATTSQRVSDFPSSAAGLKQLALATISSGKEYASEVLTPLEQYLNSLDPLDAWKVQEVAAAVDALPFAGQVAVGAGTGLFASLFALGAARALGVGGNAELPTAWDVDEIRRYWASRPIAAFKRSSGLIAKLVAWGAKLTWDIQTGKVEANSAARAAELKDIITNQGPAFVKVGQAVAIRPDILPSAYQAELQKLLDQVAPFPSDEARAVIEECLGKRLDEVFTDVSDFEQPVAAASIGQVYKATLKKADDGWSEGPVPVAVKVQRPDILECVTLDLLVLYSLFSLLASLPPSGRTKQIQQNASSLVLILTTAAERFLEELDYTLEASNMTKFEEEMNAVQVMRGAVKVPHCFDGYSSRYTLVQEWVEGRRLIDLEKDTSEEAAVLRQQVVERLLNSYMVQFLDTGFLHADPHPGNFLLMPDGRICILDYGMMTEVTPDQRLAFVEYLAHLTSGQYSKTLDDLVTLGFVPAELAQDPEKRAIVGPVLARTLEALYSEGGGMDKKAEKLQAQAKGTVGEISDKLEELTREYPIVLPPYFVLIMRAFGTLEGLGLSTDADYAIVDKCFPYIARRMLSDDSPRMRSALRTFAYGSSERLNVERVESLLQGFTEFTNNMDAETAPSQSTALTTQEQARLDAATRDGLELLFSREGNYLQELLVAEAVNAVDALSRDAAATLWQQLAAAAPLAAAASFSPLALVPGLNTLPLLAILAATNQTAINLSFQDKRNLAILRKIAEIVVKSSASTAPQSASTVASLRARASGVSIENLQLLAGYAPVIAPGAQRMTRDFSQQLAERLQQRVAQDINRNFRR